MTARRHEHADLREMLEKPTFQAAMVTRFTLQSNADFASLLEQLDVAEAEHQHQDQAEPPVDSSEG